MLAKFNYFKDSGKWYTDGECEITEEEKKEHIYPKELGKFLRQEKRLPGLLGGTWGGCFTIEVGYVELVFPEEHYN